MRTGKFFALRKTGYFQDTHYFRNIIDISIEDNGQFIRFIFSRYRFGKIKYYDMNINKSELFFYGIRTDKQEKQKDIITQ